MAYEIKFTDFVNKGSITVEDSTPNTETSLVLPGRNLTDYGKLVNENFLHLLENFANNNPPLNPVEGQLWYDTSIGVDQLKIYDGAKWVAAGNLKKSLVAPDILSSTAGDLWVDTTKQQLYLFTGSTWVLVGPQYSNGNVSGPVLETLYDVEDNGQSVVTLYLNNVAMMILSSTEFIPKKAIPGFPIIYAGINIGNDKKYYGTASRADALVVQGETIPVTGDKFARKDKANIFEKPTRITSREGLTIGETPILSLTTLGVSAFINNIASGDLTLRVNNSGILNPVVTIKNNRRVGVNNIDPTEVLDVVGNIKTSGTLSVLNQDNNSTAVSITGNANITGDITVGNIASFGNNITVNDIIPEVTDLKNIGTSSKKFNNVYARNFFGDLNGTAQQSNFAEEANVLRTNTIFSMSGHVTAPSVTTVLGGNASVQFATSLSDLFFTKQADLVTNRPEATTVDFNQDRLLISRNESLMVIKPQTITGTIPVNASGPLIPVGSIMPYVGDMAPNGWLMCDGSYVSVAAYALLFDRIKYKYGAPQTGKFKLPDFRGKFLLGYLGMAGGVGDSIPVQNNNSVINEAAASVLGASGGESKKFITEENLPDHFHSLKGDSGNQFYAVTGVPNTTDSESENLLFVSGDPINGLPLSGIKRTENIDPDNITGIRTIEEFSVVNPFATVNYIIYFGETQ